MPKIATKAADNVFYKARIAAASWNDRLGSREGASEVTGIDRTRLANIELGTINPHPEEVLMLQRAGAAKPFLLAPLPARHRDNFTD